MEIGVFNGKNASSMIKTAKKIHKVQDIEYYGFDLFANYSQNQIEKKLDTLECKYNLYSGNTLDTIPETIGSLPLMDIIFIDANIDFNAVQSDWAYSSTLMHENTGIFIHNVNFSGVNRMVKSIPRDRYNVEIFYPNLEGKVALITKTKE